MVLTNNGLSSKKRHSNGFVAFSFGEPEKILIQTIFLPSSVAASWISWLTPERAET